MGIEVSASMVRIPWSEVSGFFLVLSRLSACFTFVPIPGVRSMVAPTRVLLAFCIALIVWPGLHMDAVPDSLSGVCIAAFGELILGLIAGVVLAWLGDMVSLAMQIVSLQAGFSYASTIDPTTEADSGVLLILGQLFSNLLFFATGAHLLVIHSFVRSFEVWPAGGAQIGHRAAEALIRYGGTIIELAARLALPVCALLLLTDITLAVLGRIQAQLPLLNLSMPLKTLGAMAVLAILAAYVPSLYQNGLHSALTTLHEAWSR